jgi:hypothetical protein
VKEKKTLITGDMIVAPPRQVKPASEPKEVMNFRVSADFRHEMRQLALDERMNLSELLVTAVRAYKDARK